MKCSSQVGRAWSGGRGSRAGTVPRSLDQQCGPHCLGGSLGLVLCPAQYFLCDTDFFLRVLLFSGRGYNPLESHGGYSSSGSYRELGSSGASRGKDGAWEPAYMGLSHGPPQAPAAQCPVERWPGSLVFSRLPCEHRGQREHLASS